MYADWPTWCAVRFTFSSKRLIASTCRNSQERAKSFNISELISGVKTTPVGKIVAGVKKPPGAGALGCPLVVWGGGDGLARRAPLSALLSCVCACCVCSLVNGAAALCPVCVLPILRHRLRRSMPLRLASRASLASLGRISGISSSRITIRNHQILSRSLDHARLDVAVPSGAPSSTHSPYN